MSTLSPRLMRSRSDRMIAGIAGGISHYFAIDPLISRLVFVFLIFSGGIGIVAYLLLWLIMPNEPLSDNQSQSQSAGSPALARHQRDYKFGTLLVILGICLIVSKVMPWIYPYLIPALLIGAGLILFYRST